MNVVERPRRVFRDRLDPLNISDNELMKNYRFPRHVILELCQQLEPALGRRTARGHPLAVHTQVLISLRFLASGTFQNVLANVGNVSQSSCSRVLKPFCEAMVRLAPAAISFPLRNAGLIARIKAGKKSSCKKLYNLKTACLARGLINHHDCVAVD